MNWSLIQSAAEEQILHRIIPKSKSLGFIVYGSRASGENTEESDIDATLLVDTEKDLRIEYHGTISADRRYDIQLTIINPTKLSQELQECPISRVHSLQEASIISDYHGYLKTLKDEAQVKFQKSFDEFRFEILEYEHDELLPLIRIAFNETYKILCDQRRYGDKLGYHCRLSEFLMQYYTYSQLLVFLREKCTSLKINSTNLAFFFLYQDQQAGRFLNSNRYKLHPWFSEARITINEVLSKESDPNRCTHQIFLHLDKVFKNLIGVTLFPEKSEETFMGLIKWRTLL
jgi:hypothetical protein